MTLARFRLALRSFLAVSAVALRKHGITSQQQQAMLAIKASNEEHLSVGELAQQLLVRHHTMVRLVDRLEDNGLVRRFADSRDRRVVRLGLTPKAESVLATLAPIHLNELHRIGPFLLRTLQALELEAPADGTVQTASIAGRGVRGFHPGGLSEPPDFHPPSPVGEGRRRVD